MDTDAKGKFEDENENEDEEEQTTKYTKHTKTETMILTADDADERRFFAAKEHRRGKNSFTRITRIDTITGARGLNNQGTKQPSVGGNHETH